MKRCLALVGIILLMGAILYEKKPPAATSKSHFTSPVLTYAKTEIPHLATNSGFLDDINISLNPPEKTYDPDPNHASLTFQRDLPSASFNKLQPRLGDTTKPLFTVVNRELNYELFNLESFALKLNLKPAYPNPEARIPTRLDPGLGVSLKF